MSVLANIYQFGSVEGDQAMFTVFGDTIPYREDYNAGEPYVMTMGDTDAVVVFHNIYLSSDSHYDRNYEVYLYTGGVRDESCQLDVTAQVNWAFNKEQFASFAYKLLKGEVRAGEPFGPEGGNRRFSLQFVADSTGAEFQQRYTQYMNGSFPSEYIGLLKTNNQIYYVREDPSSVRPKNEYLS